MIYLLRNKIAKIILSIIWGLGIASLFQKVCRDRDCIIYRAPDPSKIIGNTYKVDDSCVQFEIEQSRCSRNTVNN